MSALKGHIAQNLLPTPFYERVLPLNLNHSWERWEGYLSVGCFDNIEREYTAIRNAVSVYDISPMTQYRIGGADATRFLDRLMTRDMTKVAIGQVAYAIWCDDDGKVVEDGTVFRLGERDYLINVQEQNLSWFQDTAFQYDVSIADVTEELCGLSIQGPLSRQGLEQIGLKDVTALKFFRLVQVELDGMKIILTRTGFTGDLGFEVYLRPEHALAFWDRLMATKLSPRIVPTGSHALNLARIEAGFLQVNTDFIGSERCQRHSQRRSPFELGFERLVNFKKPYFVGKRALLREQAAGGPRWRTVGLDVTGNKPADGSLLYDGNREIGRVTSAMWSPTCKRNLAIATVEAEYGALGRTMQVDIWVTKELRIEKRLVSGRVVERPFYNPPHRLT
ncbi:MAG: aminomethyltransferase family protein [Dongiaceae bacterium]